MTLEDGIRAMKNQIIPNATGRVCLSFDVRRAIDTIVKTNTEPIKNFKFHIDSRDFQSVSALKLKGKKNVMK